MVLAHHLQNALADDPTFNNRVNRNSQGTCLFLYPLQFRRRRRVLLSREGAPFGNA